MISHLFVQFDFGISLLKIYFQLYKIFCLLILTLKIYIHKVMYFSKILFLALAIKLEQTIYHIPLLQYLYSRTIMISGMIASTPMFDLIR